jgi:outer membrane autotransporter protein
MAQAASFTASTEAELITAINAANVSVDPTSTITLTAPITVATALPALHGNVTVTTNANVTTSIESAAGASLELQAGADYLGNGPLSRLLVGNTANTKGTLTVQGAGTTLGAIAVQTLAGQSTISVLDGAVLTLSGSGSGVQLGGTAGGNYSGGSANVVVSGGGSAIIATTGQYVQQAGTLEISGGGTVQSRTSIFLGAATGSFTGVVTGAGSILASSAQSINLGANGTATLTAADGATISASGGKSLITLAVGAGGGSATLNIGGAVGDAAVAPGTVMASAINGGAGTAVVNFNHNASAYDFAVPITGSTIVNHVGSGTTTLTAANTYTGATNVAAGTLRAGAADVFSNASAFNVASGATLDLAGNNQTLASVSNAGIVSTVGAAPGTTLTVTGPWVGNGGLLRLGTALGDSASVSDKLVLSGATAIASGTTNIQVNNLGGLGALTTGNGIQLVSAINGATTTAQTTKTAFALAGGHVDAGAYQYRLFAADASGAGEDWYLRSTVPVTPPITPIFPPPTATPGTSGNVGNSVVPAYRAEVPMYGALGAQLHVSDLEMLGSLHQRVGDDTGAAATGQRQAWGRLVSVDRDISQSGAASPESKGRRTGLQAGTDLWANTSWRAGVYVGQLDGSMNVFGFSSGIPGLAVGDNDLRSQYLGAYATWRNQGGFYVDTVLQAGRHRYTIEPGQSLRSDGKGSSLVASLEVGQSFALAPNWQIEPELQLMHQNLNLDDASIIGALVQQQGNDGWTVRAGVRVKGEIATKAGTLQPYGSFNVYSGHGGTSVTRFIGPGGFTDIASGAGGTSTELAAGATWQFSKSTGVYGEVGKLWDQSGDERISSGLNASIGVKVLW